MELLHRLFLKKVKWFENNTFIDDNINTNTFYNLVKGQRLSYELKLFSKLNIFKTTTNTHNVYDYEISCL